MGWESQKDSFQQQRGPETTSSLPQSEGFPRRSASVFAAVSPGGNQVLFEEGPLAPIAPLSPSVAVSKLVLQLGVCPAWPVATHMNAIPGCFIRRAAVSVPIQTSSAEPLTTKADRRPQKVAGDGTKPVALTEL